LPVEFHLLEHHRDVFAGHVRAYEPVHHPLEPVGVDRPGFGTTSIAIVADHVECQLARGGLILLGHEALDLVEEDPCWT
jgi:hypothetical protein